MLSFSQLQDPEQGRHVPAGLQELTNFRYTKMGFKVIGRKNGKKTVSDNPENDATKVTKALEFLTVAEPSAATTGSTVRFMWNPQTGTSLCWIQGEVVKTVNPHKKAKKEK